MNLQVHSCKRSWKSSCVGPSFFCNAGPVSHSLMLWDFSWEEMENREQTLPDCWVKCSRKVVGDYSGCFGKIPQYYNNSPDRKSLINYLKSWFLLWELSCWFTEFMCSTLGREKEKREEQEKILSLPLVIKLPGLLDSGPLIWFILTFIASLYSLSSNIVMLGLAHQDVLRGHLLVHNRETLAVLTIHSQGDGIKVPLLSLCMAYSGMVHGTACSSLYHWEQPANM